MHILGKTVMSQINLMSHAILLFYEKVYIGYNVLYYCFLCVFQLPPVSIYWRALLQVILTDQVGKPEQRSCLDHQNHLNGNWHVGKLASKCPTFNEYVRKAFIKLGLTDTVGKLMTITSLLILFFYYRCFEFSFYIC